ncbi:MAG TPA: GTP 3',8-cyclase MoaA [Nitriliruptorales bacterium]|nr:GTP 3',8-cyclase MoaA [Nitriliruptorales bacterium]
MTVVDRLQRPLRDLRVSVTDRCNFRCTYCMPREVFGADFAFVDRDDLLTFEEIARVARVAAGLGVRKVRITGGEPLVRRDVERLVGMLAATEGIEDLALTTNGALLTRKAAALAAAGLRRVTVSLDTVDDTTFRRTSDVDLPVQAVLDGIAAARAAGLAPIKLNAVVQRGVNDDGLIDLVAYARVHGLTVRFIEYMDVGSTNGWRLDAVVPGAEIVRSIDTVFPVAAVEPAYRGEVARRYRFLDGGGEFGVIASVTEPFCGDCTRARLSPVGELYTCLFAARGTDVRALLRSGADDARLARLLRDVWQRRGDRYSELRSTACDELPKVEMSYIGG